MVAGASVVIASMLRAQLEGLRATHRALGAGLDALAATIESIEDDDEETPDGPCPGCSATEHQAQAGDVVVCGECGKNY